MGLLSGFLQGDSATISQVARSLDTVVAALERTQAIVGREVAYSVARLLKR